MAFTFKAKHFGTYEYRNTMPEYNQQAQKEPLMDRLQFIMHTRGLTIRELSETGNLIGAAYGIKLTKSDISAYRTGRCCPKAEKLWLLSTALGVSKAWMCGYGPRNDRLYKDRDFPFVAPIGPKTIVPGAGAAKAIGPTLGHQPS